MSDASSAGSHRLTSGQDVGVCPAPVGRPHPYSIEQTVVSGREARRTRCPLVLLPRFAGPDSSLA